MWGKEETVMVWEEPEERTDRAVINLEKSEVVADVVNADVRTRIEVVDVVSKEIEMTKPTIEVVKHEFEVVTVTQEVELGDREDKVITSSLDAYDGTLMSFKLVSVFLSLVIIGSIIAGLPWLFGTLEDTLSEILKSLQMH